MTAKFFLGMVLVMTTSAPRKDPTMKHNRKGHVELSKLKGKCETGKVRFRDRQEAIEALHRAENLRKFSEQDGLATRRNEKRIYKCPLCAGHHLTSQDKRYATKEAA